VKVTLCCVSVAMEVLLHSDGDLQDSTVALVIYVRNMWGVFMEGSHIKFCKVDSLLQDV
jgi:hypothetical protein